MRLKPLSEMELSERNATVVSNVGLATTTGGGAVWRPQSKDSSSPLAVSEPIE